MRIRDRVSLYRERKKTRSRQELIARVIQLVQVFLAVWGSGLVRLIAASLFPSLSNLSSSTYQSMKSCVFNEA